MAERGMDEHLQGEVDNRSGRNPNRVKERMLTDFSGTTQGVKRSKNVAVELAEEIVRAASTSIPMKTMATPYYPRSAAT